MKKEGYQFFLLLEYDPWDIRKYGQCKESGRSNLKRPRKAIFWKLLGSKFGQCCCFYICTCQIERQLPWPSLRVCNFFEWLGNPQHMANVPNPPLYMHCHLSLDFEHLKFSWWCCYYCKIVYLKLYVCILDYVALQAPLLCSVQGYSSIWDANVFLNKINWQII